MNKQYGLYIHIPFCKSKCYYCDFYSVVADNEEIVTKYISAIEQEILFLQSKYNLVNSEIVTLYIGGGTPSLLNEQQVLLLFKIISTYYNFSSLREVTIEANPESVSKNWIKSVKELVCSINKQIRLRISLGVQSFNNKVLKLLGRQHRAYQVFDTVELLNQLGIVNYNFDLMFGCPGQTSTEVVNDIYQAIRLNPAHISFYALTVEPGTKLYKAKFLPDSDLQAEMYKKVSIILQKKGYRCYEISNFAKPGFACLHNLNYWLYKEYIGLGVSSVSFVDNKRIKNVSSVERYIKNQYKYQIEYISEDTAYKEQIMLGLRTNKGISEKNIAVQKYTEIVNNLLKKKLLIKQKQCIKIPSKYRFVSNAIILEFM